MISTLEKFSLSFLLLFIVSSQAKAQTNDLNTIFHSVRLKYAPDTRTAVFDVTLKADKNGFILSGEVDNPAARIELYEKVSRSINKKLIDHIKLLPDPKLGKDTVGIVLCGVADIRRKPSKKEELVSQALMGTAVKILKKTGTYFYVQLPDLYLGWIEKENVFITDLPGRNSWNLSDKSIVTVFKSEIREKPTLSSPSGSDVVMGCIIKSSGMKNGWVSVELADGRKGFLPDSVIQDLKSWKQNRFPTEENLEKTAGSFLGIPYLWGGTSVKGMDCSGFTKTVYRMNGFELNRDANQQAEQGTEIEPGENFRNLKKGDLIFFGKKADSVYNEQITHVGLYLGNSLFIHSSGNVHYSSFNAASKYYDASLLKRFVRARRLF